MSNTKTVPRQGSKSPSLGALLSFLWPGLGQMYAGRFRLAFIFALPAIALAAVLLYEAQDGASVLVARFLDPTFAWAALVAVVGLGLWRLLSVLHAFLQGDRRLAGRGGERMALLLLALAIVASHAAGAVYLWSAYDIGSHTFGGESAGGDVTAVTPVTGSRMTILLTGLDQYSTDRKSVV